MEQTAHEQAAAIASDARLYHLIAEGIPNMVWTAGPDGALDYFNTRVFEYTGLAKPELQGWAWQEVIHPEDRQRCEDRWKQSLADGKPYWIEYRIRRGSDRTFRWHIGAALPLRNPDGTIEKWFGTCTDIEDQKRAVSAQALLERERQLNEAQRIAQLGSWEWEAATGGAKWSDEMFRIFGRDPRSGAPTGDTYMTLYTAESWQRLLEASQRSLQTGVGFEIELEAVRPDGTTRWTRSRAECMFVAGSVTGLRGTVQDITERRAAQLELQQYSDLVKQLLHRLVDAQELERRNLASALHDLIGQNLTALNIGLDILKNDLHASAGARVGRRLDSMAATVEKTVDAIRDVMAELHPAVLEDYGLVPALHAQAQRFSELTGLRTKVEAAEGHPRLERKVELALYRIVQEALANAMKHSGASLVVIGMAREGRRVQVTVQDDGVGFTDPAGARSSRRGGWGLSAMRERAEAVGALLNIQFPEAGGTRVLVKLELPDAD